MARQRAQTQRVTIYDVAKTAGVSISTVSLALNSPSRVSTGTRERVYAAVHRLGFQPKAEAIAHARRGVGRIGVLAPFSSYASFYLRLNGIMHAIDNETMELVIIDHESAATASAPLLASLPITGRLDGLIIMGMPLDEALSTRPGLREMPIVLVDTTHDAFDVVRTADDVAGGRMVAEHLCALGHTTFAFIGESQRTSHYVSPCEQRLDGYRNALNVRGHNLSDDHVVLVAHDLEAADKPITEFIERLPRPCAVFAHDDLLAAGALRAARATGLDVPRDLAVVGFDDTDLARALDLTSVRQPFHESGTAAVDLLRERLADPTRARRTTTLQLELTVRASTQAT
jgi:DNA-binding LacI/PurR family transcriptional regulator